MRSRKASYIYIGEAKLLGWMAKKMVTVWRKRVAAGKIGAENVYFIRVAKVDRGCVGNVRWICTGDRSE